MTDTSIQWTDKTWNPVRGCPVWTGEARFVPEMLDAPLSWKKPQRVFVNSMSDLFREDVTNEQIAAVFAIMGASPRHTFQILTKRPERMRDWFRWVAKEAGGQEYGLLHISAAPYVHLINPGARDLDAPLRRFDEAMEGLMGVEWPLANVWIGVSCEDQKAADERIPLLLQCPAAVRFVSAEPLLGKINLAPWLYAPHHCKSCGQSRDFFYDPNPEGREEIGKCLMGAPMTGEPGKVRCGECESLDVEEFRPLDWVIVGGESGPGSRPCDVAWIRGIVEQCKGAGVACFVKQLGKHVIENRGRTHEPVGGPDHRNVFAARVTTDGTVEREWHPLDRKGADMSEWPADICVRQFPEGK